MKTLLPVVDRARSRFELDEQLRRGEKSLVGKNGYRKYLKTGEAHFEIDWEKAEAEARYDGLWVLQTDLNLPPAEVALKSKQLWQVEDLFRRVKSVLETRPIYHRRDDRIRGHVFCSLLALIVVRSIPRGSAGRAVQAAGVALGPAVRFVEESQENGSG